jgi:hypothetical protein
MKRLLFVLALLLANPAIAADNYTATAGSGLTFAAKDNGSAVLFSRFIGCDNTTTTQCWVVDASGRLTVNVNGTVPISAAASAAVDGWDLTQGTKADAAWVSGSGSVVAILKNIAGGVASPIPAGTATIGNVNGAPNVTPTACSATVVTGGTAVNAITAQTTLHGFTIANIDTTEVLWMSFTTTAAASGTDSYPLPPATATTFAGFGSFTTPPGFGTNHAVSVVAATNGHKFSCTWW